MERVTENTVGKGQLSHQTRQGTAQHHQAVHVWSVAAREAILEFLATTDVGRGRTGAVVEGEDVEERSEGSAAEVDGREDGGGAVWGTERSKRFLFCFLIARMRPI
jgi:hypothetical protein